VNFNIYLDDETGKRLTRLAQQCGKSRNALIREAVDAWLERSEHKGWPNEVEAFQGEADAPTFEAYREHLALPKDDPLA
jgi:predicted transcriptional regulator